MWETIDPTARPLISYSGALPTKLYRYRPVSADNLDRLIEFEILEEGVYLAGLKDLNDPDEGRFLIKFEGSRAQIASYWRKAFKFSDPTMTSREALCLANERADEIIRAGRIVPRHVIDYTRYVIEHVLRVACFTTLPVNYSMWANYAKYIDPSHGPIDHGGICIEYTCDESWRSANLHPVMYSDVVPEINVVADDEAQLTRAIYAKASEWRCENEWRIMFIIQSMPPFPSNLTANSKVRFKDSVAGVVFGLRTPDHIVSEVLGRIKKAGRSLSIKRVIRDPTTFERQLRELAKLTMTPNE